MRAFTLRKHSLLLTLSEQKFWFSVWTVFLLFNGQGFRYLLGAVGYGMLCALTLTGAFLLLRSAKPLPRNTYIILLILTVTGVTFLWSSYKSLTLIGIVVSAITLGLSIAFVRQFSWQQFSRILETALKASVVTSVLFELVVAVFVRAPLAPRQNDYELLTGIPGGAYDNWSENNLFVGGPLQGFVGNRNLLGFMVLLLAIITLFKFVDHSLHGWEQFGGNALWVTLCVALQALTGSATMTFSYIAVVIIFVGALLIRRTPPKWKPYVSYGFVGAVGVGAMFAAKYSEYLFSLVDRSPDLTNRTDIWKQVVGWSLQRPEGWGWVGYWLPSVEPFKSMYTSLGYHAVHAHNAFLDAWLQGGVLFAVLLILVFIFILGNLWRMIAHSDSEGAWTSSLMFCLTVALLLQALTESRLLLEGNWFLFGVLILYTPSAFMRRPVKVQELELEEPLFYRDDVI